MPSSQHDFQSPQIAERSHYIMSGRMLGDFESLCGLHNVTGQRQGSQILQVFRPRRAGVVFSRPRDTDAPATAPPKFLRKATTVFIQGRGDLADI